MCDICRKLGLPVDEPTRSHDEDDTPSMVPMALIVAVARKLNITPEELATSVADKEGVLEYVDEMNAYLPMAFMKSRKASVKKDKAS